MREIFVACMWYRFSSRGRDIVSTLTLVNTSQMLRPFPSASQPPCNDRQDIVHSLSCQTVHLNLVGGRGGAPHEVIREVIVEELLLCLVAQHGRQEGEEEGLEEEGREEEHCLKLVHCSLGRLGKTILRLTGKLTSTKLQYRNSIRIFLILSYDKHSIKSDKVCTIHLFSILQYRVSRQIYAHLK